MNAKRWDNVNYPHEIWISKLGEEFGEVARANLLLNRALISNDPRKAGVKARRRELIAELEHVELIARSYRKQLENEAESGEAFPTVRLDGLLNPREGHGY